VECVIEPKIPSQISCCGETTGNGKANLSKLAFMTIVQPRNLFETKLLISFEENPPLRLVIKEDINSMPSSSIILAS
jgi:hypothetical protein